MWIVYVLCGKSYGVWINFGVMLCDGSVSDIDIIYFIKD